VAGLNLSWTALAGAVLLMVVARRDTHEVLKIVDWHLLVFFAALFIVVEGLNGTGLPDQIYHHVRGVFGQSAATRAGIWRGSRRWAPTCFPMCRSSW